MSRQKLTLKDKLSRLTFTQAGKLLGPDGKKLIIDGGKFEFDGFPENVTLTDERFEINVDGAGVTITLNPDVRSRLDFHCDRCPHNTCEHVGAAFAVILEEKTVLGLARPPIDRIPVESLNDTELIERALGERWERSKTERMTVKSANNSRLWTDYIVTNSLSGKSYRVALRGWERGESFCSCPDFRKNTLGTCKHVMNVQRKVKRRFSKTTQNRPYRQKEFAVHIAYGKKLELRLLCPKPLPPETRALVKPVADKTITSVAALLRCIRKLEAAGFAVTVYPDAEEYIDFLLHKKRLDAMVREIRRNPKKHPLRTSLLKAELLPYQLDGIAFAAGAGRAILADDMGLGKTIQGIGAAELLSRTSQVEKVLIICPTSLKSQWRSEINRFSDKESRLVLGIAAERPQQYGRSFFTICNYEQVLRDITDIESIRWDLIILDEGQRIKNWTAKTTKTIKSMHSRFALVLSGTPLENRLDDLFSIVEFVDDRRLGPSFRFFNHYRVVNEKGKLLGYKNLDRLREKLKPILLRRTRGTVMKELPPRTDEVVRIAPSQEQFDINTAQKRVISSILNKAYISEMDLLRLQKALLLCRMAADSTYLVNKIAPGYSTKLERLAELLQELNEEEDRKIVLFSEWTTMLDLIEPIINKLKMEYVRLDGSVPQKKRAQLMARFQDNPDCRLFITTNAGSTGLNLHKADTVINVDLPWNPAVLEQRIARAHRMGQKNPVQVYILISENTIEENMLATLAAKKEIALASLDMESEVTEVDMASGMENLKQKLEILLGRQEEAPVDQSELKRREEELEQVRRREKIASAAGEMFTSAFTFLGEVLPETAASEKLEQRHELIKNNLKDCMTFDEDGRIELKLKLNGQAALNNIVQALAKMAG